MSQASYRDISVLASARPPSRPLSARVDPEASPVLLRVRARPQPWDLGPRISLPVYNHDSIRSGFERIKLECRGVSNYPVDSDWQAPSAVQPDVVKALADEEARQILAAENRALRAEAAEADAVQKLSDQEKLFAALEQEKNEMAEDSKKLAAEVSTLRSELEQQAESEKKISQSEASLGSIREEYAKAEARAQTESGALEAARNELAEASQAKDEVNSLKAAQLVATKCNSTVQDELKQQLELARQETAVFSFFSSSISSQLTSVKASAEASAKALEGARLKIESLEAAEAEATGKLAASKKSEEEVTAKMKEDLGLAKLAQSEAEEAVAREKVKCVNAVAHAREEAVSKLKVFMRSIADSAEDVLK